jgi:hypothetical protein
MSANFNQASKEPRMTIKNCVAYGGVSLFMFSLVTPALREAMPPDMVKLTRTVLTVGSREPVDLPHIDLAVHIPADRLYVTARSATGANTVDQTHWIDAYIAPRSEG